MKIISICKILSMYIRNIIRTYKNSKSILNTFARTKILHVTFDRYGIFYNHWFRWICQSEQWGSFFENGWINCLFYCPELLKRSFMTYVRRHQTSRNFKYKIIFYQTLFLRMTLYKNVCEFCQKSLKTNVSCY